MRKSLLFTLAVGTGGLVLAQAPPPAAAERDAVAEMSSAQKRIELRNVLSAGRNAEPPTPRERQLSQQERAEMREQLRRFQPAASRPQQP